MPRIAEGEVLVRMRFAAICGSDLHVIYDGFSQVGYPGPAGYPGHEGVGEIVATRHPAWAVGTPVLTLPDAADGGSFAEYQCLSADRVVELPPGPSAAKLLQAQQLGTAIWALKRFLPAPPSGGAVAVVIGVGSAGLHFVQLLRRLKFSKIIVSDVVPARVELARSLGADFAALAPDASIVDVVSLETGAAGADLVIDTAGLDSTRSASINCVRYNGTIGWYGYPETHGPAPLPFDEMFRRAPSVYVSRGAQLEPGLASFREAIVKIHNGEVVVDHLLTNVITFTDLLGGLEVARKRAAVKVVIEMPNDGR